MSLSENLVAGRRPVSPSEILPPFKEVILVRPPPPIINEIMEGEAAWVPVFATGNPEKVKEAEAILGRPIRHVDLKVDEIQDDDPIRVAEMKAVAAWEKNDRQPIIVEDTSLRLVGISFLPGTFDKFWAGTPEIKRNLCHYLTEIGADRRAIAQVTLAIFDGNFIHTRIGQTTGVIPEIPIGAYAWDWDDIFIADGQDKLKKFDGRHRTFAEMTLREKNRLSPRGRAWRAWKEYPVRIGQFVYMLPEPYPMQTQAIQVDILRENPLALRHAYNLNIFEDQTPQGDLSAPNILRPRVTSIGDGKGVYRYVTDPNSPDLGIIVTAIDIAVDFNDRPVRLFLDNNNNPKFWQMGPEAIKMALAARAWEFIINHNDETYALIRSMLNGQNLTPKRTNIHSDVIEQLIELVKFEEDELKDITPEEVDRVLDEAIEVLFTAATNQLGYVRQYSDREDLSRKIAANKGLILTSTGIPSSLYALGGMPPVTGWKDVLTTAALSFMDSYVPHNSIFVNKELRLQLFISARDAILELGLPSDIEQLVIAHLGISVGTEDYHDLAEFVNKAAREGCSLWRVYTTNPGRQTVTSAEVIRDATEQSVETSETIRQIVQLKARISVGPIVNLNQAWRLIQNNILVNTLIAGHGGGENCTSLLGGGAANSLELAY
ncbi:hypothetical protein A2W14_06490, partial [Candidatus Gottesmanbacteria bacterium RBG_16_37_8]